MSRMLNTSRKYVLRDEVESSGLFETAHYVDCKAEGATQLEI